MTSVADVLDGIEAALELERDLGVRFVDFDRSLLAAPAAAPAAAPSADARPMAAGGFVFLHDRPLSDEAREMMAKIVKAMGSDEKASPVVTSGPLPSAKVCIVLGARALKKWFPGLSGSPGRWMRSPNAGEILVTYSPEHVLLFSKDSPEQRAVKREMWNNLKTVAGHL